MDKYNNWVRGHPREARYIEEALHHVAWLVPSWIGDESGVAAELFYSSSGLLALLHDHVLAGDASVLAPRTGRSSQEEFELAIRWGLTALRSIEVVMELSARRLGGDAARWKAVLAIETVKAVAQLSLLQQSRNRYKKGKPSFPDAPAHRLLINGGCLPEPVRSKPHDEDEEEDGDGEGEEEGGGGEERKTRTPDAEGRRWWVGQRSGVRIGLPKSVTREVAAELGVETSEDGAVNSLRSMGEVLFILRPVLYAATRMLSSERSWIPVLVSALMDVSSFACHAIAERAAVGETVTPGRLLADPGAPLPGAAAFMRKASGPADLVLRHLVDATRATLSTLRSFASPRSLPPAGELQPHHSTRPSTVSQILLFLLRPQEATSLSPAERDELVRRQRLWLLYLLRTPLFDLLLRRIIDGTVDTLQWVPLIGFLANYARDMVLYYQRIHFYTS